MTRLRYLLPLFAFLLAVGLIACGGGGGNDDDPQKVLDETFSSDQDYSSGVLDIALNAQGNTVNPGNVEATIKGPFESTPGGFPKFDLDATIKGTVPFDGGLISTGDAAFVSAQGTDYEIDANTFSSFKQFFLGAQAQSDKQGSSGVDLSQFLTDISNDGTEDVNDAKTIHVSGKVDVDKLVAAAKVAAGNDKGQVQRLDDARSAVEGIDVDIFSDESDKHLVKLDVDVGFNPNPGSSAGNFDFSIGFADLGQPQSIAAPSNPKPFSDLLGLLQGLSSGAGGVAGGTDTTQQAPTSTQPPTPPSDGATAGYLNCLSQAKTQDAVQACSSQLQ